MEFVASASTATGYLNPKHKPLSRTRRVRLCPSVLALGLAVFVCAAAYADPAPDSLYPNTGICAGGTHVEFSGSGFDDIGTTQIAFGGTPATGVTVIQGYGGLLTVVCETPPHASGAVDVVVMNPDGSSATMPGAFTYCASVQSVSVVDSHHIDVTFDTAMGTNATVSVNYELHGAGAGSLSFNPASVALQSGNTYRLSWTSGDMVAGEEVMIVVRDVLDANGNPLGTPDRGTSTGIGSNPTVASVKVHAALSVDVVFSEEMDAAAEEVASYTLSGSGKGSLSAHPDSAAKLDAVSYRLTWLSGEMVNTGNITVTVSGPKDLGGSAMGTPNSGADTSGGIGTAPTLASVEVFSGLEVDVTFSEAMDSAADLPASYTIGGTGKGTLAANPNTVTPLGGAKYRLTWNSGEMKNGGDIAVQAGSLHDAAGNALALPDTGTDVGGAIGVLPTVVSAEVTAGSSVSVTFSEPLGSGATLPANYTISGPGKGTLAAHPTSVALISGSTYGLTWSSGDMLDSEDVTITVAGVADLAGNPLGTPDSATDVGGGVFILPTADAITPVATPVNSPVRFSVTFSKAVKNFSNASDVVITETGTVAHTSVLISGGPTTYEVRATGVMGDGTMSLAVNTASDVKDLSNTPLSSSVTSSPATVDNTAPEVLDISPVTVSPTNSDAIQFTVVFSEAVRNFDGSEALAITKTGSLNFTGAAISGGPTTYTVNVSGVTGDGAMSLAVDTAAGVEDMAANPVDYSLVSSGVTVDNTAPSAVAITRVTASPTNGSSLRFSVGFSESVTGFNDESDLVIHTTGSLASSGVAISGGPQNYNIDLFGVTGDGSASIEINTASGIADGVGNALASSPTSSAIVVDQTPPSATLELITSSPASMDAVAFTLTFSESVAGSFDVGAVELAEGSLGGSIAVTGDGPAYTVTVTLTDPDADGSVAIALADGVTDAAGNPCPALTSTSCDIYNWHGFTAEPADAQIYTGESKPFRVTADCASPTITYAWKWEDSGKTVHDIGSDSPVYTVSTATTGRRGEYWCVVTFDGVEHESIHAVLSVEEHLEIAIPPQNAQAVVGSPFSFSVVTSGGYLPLTYVWKKDGERISEATVSSFDIPALDLGDAGSYTVEISDAHLDSVASNAVVLTVAQGAPVTTSTGVGLLIALLALTGRSLSRKE